MGVEVELRYQIADVPELRRALADRGATPRPALRIEDLWFVPAEVADYHSHELWLLSGLAAPVRLRRVGKGDQVRSILEVKRPLRPGDYSVNIESAVPIDDFVAGANFMEALGFVCVARLDKQRISYECAGFDVAIDEYDEGTVLVEFEMNTQSGVEDIESLHRSIEPLGSQTWQPIEGSAALLFIRERLKRVASELPAES